MAQVDYLILCDSAQVAVGKLYILGGSVNQFPRIVPQGMPAQPCQFAIAVGLLVPWLEGNDHINLRVTVEDPEARQVFAEFGGELVAGRAPQTTPGSDLLAPLAMPITMVFPAAGEYVVRARVENRGEHHEVRKAIQVVDQLVVPLPPQPGP